MNITNSSGNQYKTLYGTELLKIYLGYIDVIERKYNEKDLHYSK